MGQGSKQDTISLISTNGDLMTQNRRWTKFSDKDPLCLFLSFLWKGRCSYKSLRLCFSPGCPQHHLAMILISAFHFMYFIKVFLHFPGIAHILNFAVLCAYICIYVYLIYVYIWVPRGIINYINLWHKISLSSSKIFLHAFIIHVYFYHSRSSTKRRPHVCSTLAIASVWLFPCSSNRGLVIEKLKTKKKTQKNNNQFWIL